MGQAASPAAQTAFAAPERTAAEQSVFADLDALRDVFAMLPVAVTVSDARGRVVFANEAAAEQFRTTIARLLAGTDAALTRALAERRDTCIELVRTARSQTAEEVVGNINGERVFLTTHRPVWIAERRLVLSSSVEITEHKATEAELFHRAYFDDLTGLPNRKLIEQHADHLLSLRNAPRFALAFLDIDNFKHINDYYGHAAGDALLVEVAKRLSRDLRRTDTLSRISGDEFLLLLSPVQSLNEVADFIDHLAERMKTPFFIEGSEIFAAASIGVSLYPDHGQSFKQLRQNADIAMYRVKHDTKGTALFFDASMEREAAERTEIEQALRVAILEKRFRCVFQPKVDIRTREVKGIEALVRLKDDRGEIQAPGSFINLAVELGLIDDLTHLVLAEIMRSIDHVNAEFGRDTSISINVAAKQAGDVAFMASFARALEATGCANRFIIEVTEDAFLSKAHFQTEILPAFRELGVGISIDDFGVGYSSLSALADITADEIKIDRSFIMDIHKRPRSQGILRAIVSLAEALGMTVIAEGVESHEELAYLQAATKIRYAQGYYFSKPIFLDELQPGAGHVVSDARHEDFGRQRIAARSGR
jgi:diguanylate cyclase (GGDEF)-like protein